MSINGSGPRSVTAALALFALLPLGAHAASTQATGYYPSFAPDAARITGHIDNSQRVSTGERPALAIPANDAGALPSTQNISNVTLLLKRSAVKQKQYDAYVHGLTNPSSPYFHHWLTAAQIGSMFGPAQSDIDQVEQWLQGQGLRVTSISPTGMMIHFSGNAAAVGSAFNTSLHSYVVNGEKHFANNSAQQIPAALAPVVTGVVSLGNFFPKPQHVDVGTVTRDKSSGHWKTVARNSGTRQFTPPGQGSSPTIFDVAPADFNTIYNVTPLWSANTPIRGAGQTVAVLERTDVLAQDIQNFRSTFLPANAAGDVSYVHPLKSASDTSCTDPGTNRDEGEAALDTEWAGSAAPDANIVFASCNDVNSPTFGPFTAAENLLSAYSIPVVPTIFSLSYGECESDGVVDGTAEQAYELWEQAAAQGVTVFVSTGDAGSAGCDQNETSANQGIGVNSMASTPYNVAVGGTDFNDINDPTTYWSTGNSALYASALSHIPEMTWNDSCASSVLDSLLGYSNGVQACNSTTVLQQFPYTLTTAGGSGGSSMFWSQPIWQAGISGSSNFGTRMIPDVSLFAANGFYGHALIYCMSDPTESGTPCDYTNLNDVNYNSAGGTSFAAPAMAGVQALINQANGQSSGNILPALYNIASKQFGTNASPNKSMLSACNASNGANMGSNCVFNNVTVGNNAVPCFEGTSDCYTGPSVESYGVVSAGGSADLLPAWNTNAGYNLATGLGSVNVTNLVNALTKFNKPFQNGYIAPYNFLSPTNNGALPQTSEAQANGFSDIAFVNPTTGVFTQLAMKGSTVLQSASLTVAPGYTIGTVGEFFAAAAAQDAAATPAVPIPVGYQIGSLAWTGPGNQLWIWLSNGAGGASGYSSVKVGNPYAAGWVLIGSGNFDGSGSDELFWWNSSTNQIEWWTVQPPATAGGNYTVTVSPVITVAAANLVPHLADINGDGVTDIVWTSNMVNDVFIWTNNGQGGFTNTTIPNPPAGFTLFGAGDVTGTGKTALFWVNPSSNQMMVWNVNGASVTSTAFNTSPGFTVASIADYDGDGLADLLWVGPGGQVWEWLSDGNGSFYGQQVADAAGSPFVVPAGAQVQANRFQGGKNMPGANTSKNFSH